MLIKGKIIRQNFDKAEKLIQKKIKKLHFYIFVRARKNREEKRKFERSNEI